MLLSAEAGTTARTGVEMEAMTACAVAALTVYDMVKGLERGRLDRGDRAGREERRAQRRVEAGVSHGAREPGEIGAAVLTISTSRARGEGEDESGPALAAFAERVGATVIGTEVIADERELIEGRLRWWCDEGGCELVLTTGGTGFAPDDVTPEATRAVIEREAPGDRRGDAGRVARAHGDVDGLARGRRHPGPGTDRQLPRQPAGDRAGRRRDRRGAPARARAADPPARPPALT